MTLSIIIPVYNEARTVAEAVRRAYGAPLPAGCARELVVVDDGSTDDTPFVLEGLKKEMDFCLLAHRENRGKGAAIRTALSRAKGELVVIQDADLEYDPREISALLSALREGVAAVYGARGVRKYPKRGLHFVAGAKLLTWLANLLFRARLTDLYTGYKLFRMEAISALPLRADGFEFEAEVSCELLKRGYRIVEVPLARYSPRSVAEGKKISWRDAWRGLCTILSAYGRGVVH